MDKAEKSKAARFWALSLTWGLPLTLIGLAIAIVLTIFGYSPKKFHYMIRFEVGENWGGFSLGGFIFTNENPSLHTQQHEAGHCIQNTVFGFAMPFLVSIPSAVRYWYREYLRKVRKKTDLPAYESIWFEKQATEIGEKYFPEEISCG